MDVLRQRATQSPEASTHWNLEAETLFHIAASSPRRALRKGLTLAMQGTVGHDGIPRLEQIVECVPHSVCTWDPTAVISAQSGSKVYCQSEDTC